MPSRRVVVALLLASGCGKKKSEPAAEPTPAVQPAPPPVAAVPVDAAAAPVVIDAPPQWGGPGSCAVKITGAATLEQPDARGVVDAVTVNCSGTRVQLTVQPDAGALAANKHFVIGKDRVTVSAAIDGTMLEGIEGTFDIKAFAPPDAKGTFVLAARLPTGPVKLEGVLDTCPACAR